MSAAELTTACSACRLPITGRDEGFPGLAK
jgi:hypothetical protein